MFDECPPDALVIVVAPNHEWFVQWCREMKVSPHDRRLRSITSLESVMRLSHGRQRRDGDHLVYLGHPSLHATETMERLQQALLPCGFTVMEDANGDDVRWWGT